MYEGLVVTLFDDDTRPVYANQGSEYYDFLHCNAIPCSGTVIQYIDYFFGGKFVKPHLKTDAIVLGCILVVARLCTYFALQYLRFTAT